jgi:hypothetical protein
MDVRSIEDVSPVVEHNGTVPVWWLIQPREMKEITQGGYLELANEFEVKGGERVFPTRTRRMSSITSRQVEGS